MKFYILILTILIIFKSNGQPHVTIDKSEATNVLFDYNDPFSLVSLLYNNQARAIDMNAIGMDIKTKRKLEKKRMGLNDRKILG